MTSRLSRSTLALATIALALVAALMPIGSGQAQAAGDDPNGWMLFADGSIRALGDAPSYGDAPDRAADAVALAASSSGRGYLVVYADGVVSAHGDAVHHGDLRGLPDLALDAQIVDIAVSGDGAGYLMLGADGGVFAFGGQPWLGSAPSVVPVDQLNGAAVALLVAKGGSGYSIVFDDGGVFSFGMAFHGSVPQFVSRSGLAGLIVGAVEAADGAGYALVGTDGGVFAFGSYSFLGSLSTSGRSYTALAGDGGGGYLMLSTSGSVHRFGGGGGSSEEVLSAQGGRAVGLAMTTAAAAAATTTTTSTTSTSTSAKERPTSTTTIKPSAAAATTAAPKTTVKPKPTTTTTTKPKPKPTTTTTAAPKTTQPKPTTTTTQPSGGSGGGGGATGAQLSLWGKYNQTFTGKDYWTPPQCPKCPKSFLGPVNYANGTAHIKITVTSTKSTKPFELQLCMWNHSKGNWKLETCAPRVTINGTGTYKVDLGKPSSWWKLNGVGFPWHLGPDVTRIMVKDPGSASLLMDSKCGKACFSGAGQLSARVPITFSAEVIFVQQGKSFKPPAGW